MKDLLYEIQKKAFRKEGLFSLYSYYLDLSNDSFCYIDDVVSHFFQ